MIESNESFASLLERRIEKIVQELIIQVPEQLKTYIEVSKEFVMNSGKRLRPTLLLYSYLGYGGRNFEDALTLAAVVEIMHNFLLIHDDVIDDSNFRRGKPTVHVTIGNALRDEKLGKDVAIVIGDILSFHCIRYFALLSVDYLTLRRLIDAFSKCYVLTGFGQLLDIIYSGRIDEGAVDSEVPTEISCLKTAYYTFSYPLVFGYLLTGGNDSEEESRIIKFGEKVGIAFQYRDDIYGVFGGERKSTNDIQEGKFTALLQTALKLLPEAREEIIGLINRKDKLPEEIERIAEYIRNSGALDVVRKKIESLVSEGLKLLEELKISSEYKEKIKILVTRIAET
ncbi:polyprenyl synthetase family protein [Fervidobacterium thailandense]|uniref:Polyprenyl synthetase family protein n=1 Tax=Fervidobacterium thailandense TaxID=1008305 RepID=A0A1E3G730_9BACT|nr:polyprenyl synthetase family protein [Fervidobacterium thailandense]ODN31418.1 hypothetical protein A4H02_01295 [Fervidobacterium thailandense]